jgi:hypothetical protein
MPETDRPQNTAPSKAEHRRERVADQERSGLSVRQFCRERELSEYAFYAWRRRLRKGPVRFALIDRTASIITAPEPSLELVLASGERLRIGAGVDAATLRLVLEALRA